MVTIYRVMGIDPGGKTGVAYVDIPQVGDHVVWKDLAWTRGEITDENHHQVLADHISQVLPDEIILEGWDNRAQANAHLISLEYVGVVKYACQELKIPCTVVSASTKSWADDRKLKQLNLYLQGMPHARDATRHLVNYLVNRTPPPIRAVVLRELEGLRNEPSTETEPE
jgi:hypothetical protein